MSRSKLPNKDGPGPPPDPGSPAAALSRSSASVPTANGAGPPPIIVQFKGDDPDIKKLSDEQLESKTTNSALIVNVENVVVDNTWGAAYPTAAPAVRSAGASRLDGSARH
jgi:hypothetical protein